MEEAPDGQQHAELPYRPLFSSIAGVGEKNFGINQLDYLAYLLTNAYPDSTNDIAAITQLAATPGFDVRTGGNILQQIEEQAESSETSTRT